MSHGTLRPFSRLLLANVVALATAATLALAALGFSLSYRLSERAGLERLAELAVERLELYAGTLEGELGRLAQLPALVSLNDEVMAAFQSDHPELLQRAQRRLAQINARAGSLLIYLVDADGHWRLGSAALPLEVLERERLERIAAALRAGRPGFFAAGDGSGTTDFFHASTVQRGGKTLGQVVVRINLAPLEATWVDLGVRSRSEKLLVLDANDVLIMSSVPQWKYLRLVQGLDRATWPRLAPEDTLHYPAKALQTLRWAEREGAVRGGQLLRLQPPEDERPGQHWLAQDRPVMALGLRLMTLSDPSEVQREAGRAAWGGAALGGLIGLLATYYLYRRRAVAQLLRARNELQRARDELEQQVWDRTAELRAANAELKREFEQRVRAEDELVQAGKMAVLGQLSAGIAHEVNQPLTALRALSGNTVRLMDAGRLDDARRNLGNIEGAVERMARITSQLKSFARRASGQGEVVRLAHAVGNAQLLLEHRIREAGVELQLQISERLNVRCDGTRLEQVLVNLMGNAIDAMDALQNRAERRLQVRAWAEDTRIHVAVRDTGPGLSPEAQERLFEPFFTTKPAGQGLGLGLVISAQIVREFGGNLQASSSPEGTEFRFDLEAAPAAAEEKNHV
ncbi:sensor histidine kinase [Inhella proteolytica]|uniref:C4-dicarboxylate transport sensor protein DctB n=1 Tax=Inhella proteolytica TaxID=2795029 RepID=A0A931J2S4_9BURK|nr:ATP-binding protein [Inhella proteolytica]MBH9575287.1 sensor histidine kinase [Inhella proteolytica]